ncbi:MAG TPA: hypothetical protein VF796_18390 [Humisphaera sp.]
MPANRRHRHSRPAGPRTAGWCEPLEARALLSAGDPDLTFSLDGRLADLRGTADDVAVQADGKVVVAGTSVDGQFLIARYNANGSVDTTFGGGDGVVTTSFVDPHTSGGSWVNTVVVLPGGKIFAAGNAGPYQRAFARYNADGSLDTTYGTGGKRVEDAFTELPAVFDAAVAPDGSVLTAGTLGDDDGTWDVLTVNGKAFQVGRAPNDPEMFGRHDAASAVAADPGGRILVAGASQTFGAFVGRLNPDLSIDPTFGPGGADLDGWASGLPYSPTALAALPNGKVLVGGTPGPGGSGGVFRLNGDGSLDKTFGGGDGKAAEGFAVKSMAVQADGRIVIVGGTGDFVVRRLNYDGSADTTFDNGDGQVTTDFGRTDAPASVAIAPNGRTVVAGNTSAVGYPGRVALAAYKGTAPVADTITVAGTTGNDTIRVAQSGTTLTVTTNGTAKTYNTAGKTKLVVTGGNGDDTIWLAPSVTLNATLIGGNGKDVLHGGGGRDDYFGGPDTDFVDYSDAAAGVAVSLDDLANDGVGRNENVHSDVENAIGSAFADTLVGNALPNVLVGNAGADVLRGFAGRDVLIGGAGADTLDGGADDDLVIGSRTLYDASAASLRTLGFEWRNPANAYATRVARLTAGVLGVKVDKANVPTDLATDADTGGTGQDWFVTHWGDALKDNAANETVTLLSSPIRFVAQDRNIRVVTDAGDAGEDKKKAASGFTPFTASLASDVSGTDPVEGSQWASATADQTSSLADARISFAGTASGYGSSQLGYGTGTSTFSATFVLDEPRPYALAYHLRWTTGYYRQYIGDLSFSLTKAGTATPVVAQHVALGATPDGETAASKTGTLGPGQYVLTASVYSLGGGPPEVDTWSMLNVTLSTTPVSA